MKVASASSRKRLPKSFQELNRVLPLRPIDDDTTLDRAQSVADRLAVLDRRSADQEAYLETLTLLIEKYEDLHHAIDTSSADALANLRFLLEQHGMSGSDLGRLLGQRQLGAKILSQQRELSKAHIRKLAAHFGVGPEVFLGSGE